MGEIILCLADRNRMTSPHGKRYNGCYVRRRFSLTMNNIDIRKKLRDIAREVFSDEGLEITDELSQDDVKAWDSLGHIRLVAATEDAFQITFTMDEIEGLKRMGQIVELIAEKA